MTRYQNKIILLTGATSGIGKVLLKQFASMGAHVLAVGRSEERLNSVINEVKQQADNANVTAVVMDTSQLESVRNAAAIINASIPKIDILINNAGYTDMGNPAEYKTKEGLDLIYATNYFGPVLLTELLLPLLENTEKAQVLNIASTAIFKFYNPNKKLSIIDGNPNPKYATLMRYAESKMALLMYSLERAEGLRQKNIFMNGLILKDVVLEKGKTENWSMAVKLLNTIIAPLKLTREQAATLYLDVLALQDKAEFLGEAISSSGKVARLPKYALDQEEQIKLLQCTGEIIGVKALTEYQHEPSSVVAV
ncbi:SDR family NAD(P)-dependent oxidoreductase [Aliikangiella maris]|uniref:SDR family NAD(P)-dependent oxidoreductase n=2 Tax=Aliikangiella maris TaxID=3162458 RepID=A0ABV2BUA3_9GAMM